MTLAMSNIPDKINLKGIVWDKEVTSLGVCVDGDGDKSFVVKLEHGTIKPIKNADNIAEARRLALELVVGEKTVNNDLSEILLRCDQKVPVDAFYKQIADLKIVFGPSFRNFENIWRNESEAIGLIEFGDDIVKQAEKYLVHPVFLDSCLQIFGATLFSQDSRKTYLPTGIEELKILGIESMKLTKVWSYVKLRKEIELHDTTAYADLYFYDECSNILGYAKGFSLKLAASSELLLKDEEERKPADYYQIKWIADPILEKQTELEEDKYNWLLVCENNAVNAEYEFFLEEKCGTVCTQIMEDKDFSDVKSEINQMFSDACKNNKPINAVLFKASNIDIDENIECVASKQKIESSYCLAIAQALSTFDVNQKALLWLITEGSQKINGDLAVDPSQATLWGLGRTINKEMSGIACKNIDLDQKAIGAFETVYAVEIAHPYDEQSAWRGQQRYCAKLYYQNFDHRLDRDSPFQLKIDEYGAIENLKLKPLDRKIPADNEVEIKVCASPINFKDVLHVLGMLQVDGQQSGIDDQQDMLFGGDCAGFVVRAGKSVSDFKVGDKVIATMAFGCMASHVTVDQNLIAPMPESIDYAAASNLTTSYITAHYALNELAKIKSGDKVLIHAGAGGLGMAAIHLAKAKGATVYATAHPNKWHALEKLGLDKIMHSRTLDFADELSSEPYAGVDVVLNSLSGEFIAKSFGLLKENGRFIEVGKIDILTKEQASIMRPDVDYHAFDLMDLVKDRPGYFKQLFLDVIDFYKAGRIPLLESKSFDIEAVHEAFDWMAQANHTGKVVLSMLPDDNAREIISSDGAYIISGGLGALGRILASWLVAQGAKCLYLLSRSDNKIADYPDLQLLTSNDVTIIIIKCDVASCADVFQLFSDIEQKNLNVNGIFHAAGVLNDGVISEQCWSHFESVYQAKITGALNLHRASLSHNTDLFVIFSSIAGAFGSEGQSNYAAANAFLDSFAEYRKSKNLPAISINWGPWKEGGMASELDRKSQQRIAALGIDLITPEAGMQYLNTILDGNAAANSIVLPINWQVYFEEYQLVSSGFYSAIKGAMAEGNTADYQVKLNGLNSVQAEELIIKDLTKILAKVLRLATDEQIESTLRLNELGIDSLMGVELKNRIDKQFSVKLSVSVLIESPSIEQLASKILELILPDYHKISNVGKKGSYNTQWIVNYPGLSEADSRLICFHHLGGSAEFFRSWRKFLPENVDLCVVQLPGRAQRRREKALTDINDIMDALISDLEQYLDIPYVFFGQSMGTLLAYETISSLGKKAAPLPQHLYVAALWPPLLHDKQRDRDLPSAERLDELEIPHQLLDDLEFKEELKNTIAADEALLRNYRWQAQEKLTVPITAFSGQQDTVAEGSLVKHWQQCTNETFEYQEFPGKHMFVSEHQQVIIQKIVSALTRYHN